LRRASATAAAAAAVSVLVLAGCGEGPERRDDHVAPAAAVTLAKPAFHPLKKLRGPAYKVPPLLDKSNVYAADVPNRLSRVVVRDRPLVYVPNSLSNTVDEIDPRTYKVVRHFRVGTLPQHVVPSYDLKTLWVNNDQGNSLTPINPVNGKPGKPVRVLDPYNLYFTPDGSYAVVMAEAYRRIDFRNPHTMKLHHTLNVPSCPGVNHADFTADGRVMLASCEFGARMIVVDVPHQKVLHTIKLPRALAGPQDVKLSPDGRVFYVADMISNGVWKIGARTFRVEGFIRTGMGAHGLYVSRDSRYLYVSNRGEGSISLISLRTRKPVRKWHIPGGGSPDMGGVSADGRTLWLAGRYSSEVYAINTLTGKLRRRIPVGLGPHGLCVYPQPGRYSLGHTGVFR
jgi:DNA-binding beta-propeller fold protein YncE